MLSEVGIDTEMFKAHSVRGASSSAALRNDVHISDILQTADWSKDSTFKQFYHRPVADDGYASAVLNCVNSVADIVHPMTLLLL